MTQEGDFFYNIVPEFGIPIMLVRLIKMCLSGICRTVQIGKHFCDAFPIQNGLKQGDTFLPLTFNFPVQL
jgi:hypothetical protein